MRSPNRKKKRECTHTKKHESWIELHILCLLKYRHRYRIIGNSKEYREGNEWFFPIFREDIREATDDRDRRKYATELIHIECLSSIKAEEESSTSKELPNIKPCSLKNLTRSCHNLWIIHVDSEIIPSDWHRPDNIDEGDREEKCEKEKSKLYREESRIQRFNKIL